MPYSVDSASTRIKRGLCAPCCAALAMTSKLVLAAVAAAGFTGSTFACGVGAGFEGAATCLVGEVSAGAGLAGAALLGSSSTGPGFEGCSNTGPGFEGCGAVTPCELFEFPQPILPPTNKGNAREKSGRKNSTSEYVPRFVRGLQEALLVKELGNIRRRQSKFTTRELRQTISKLILVYLFLKICSLAVFS